MGLLCSYKGIAQPDSAVSLPVITVHEARFEQTGYSVRRLDSLPVAGANTLADHLLWSNAVAVRAGAPGTLATVSARGSGPSHTPVFWQGVNLQSPMNGVVDAALIPCWAGDPVELRYGGQSAAQSSGAMGGAIHLGPRDWKSLPQGWSGDLNAAIGGFGHVSGQGNTTFRYGPLATTVRASWWQADNDFPYRNTALLGAPVMRQVNNFGQRLDIQQFNQIHVNEYNQVESAVWYQRAYRQIPPSMTEAPAETWQRDRAWRAVANWRHVPASNRQALWQHRVAWLDESIDFYLAGATEPSRSRTALAYTEFASPLGRRVVFKTALNTWWQQARAAGYTDSTHWYRQLRVAGVGMAEFRWRTGRLSALLRQEWAEKQAAPFTWSLGMHWQPWGAWTIQAHISRNFNLPTFNDRYWKTLGNPDLKPESGYSAELGGQWSRGHLTAALNLFHVLLDDWILWLPGAGGQFRPGNLRQVWSRGSDLWVRWTGRWLGSDWKIRVDHQVAYTTNTAVYDGNTAALHRQLPYTPRQSGSAGVHWSAGRWSAAYTHQWTGNRFRTADNSIELPAFHTGNLFTRFVFPWCKNRLSLSVHVENCWNTPYQILEFRPMPGRTWRVGFDWQTLPKR